MGSTIPRHTGRYVSRFSVPKMDCAAEERMIRLALDGSGAERVDCDLGKREVEVLHAGDGAAIAARLSALGLGAAWLDTRDADPADMADDERPGDQAQEKDTLRLLLAINALMFAFELVTGVLAESAGLIADSLDMFADAAVYGVALYAAARSRRWQIRAARLAGGLQALMALGLLLEVGRRALGGSEPVSALMMAVGVLALAANIVCLAQLHRHRHGGVHMRASWIFSANDVLANLGVIAAGALVAASGSNLPDLVIGGVIGFVVLSGAWRILRLPG